MKIREVMTPETNLVGIITLGASAADARPHLSGEGLKRVSPPGRTGPLSTKLPSPTRSIP